VSLLYTLFDDLHQNTIASHAPLSRSIEPAIIAVNPAHVGIIVWVSVSVIAQVAIR